MLLACFLENQLNLQEEKITKGKGDPFVVVDSNSEDLTPATKQLRNEKPWND